MTLTSLPCTLPPRLERAILEIHIDWVNFYIVALFCI